MKVYFSRDPKDTAQADEDRFSQTLREAGLEPVDGAADLAAGNDWQQTIGEKLNTSDALVFVIGPESEKSPWLQRQWSASVEESWTNPDKPMIPILIGNAEPPPFLRDRNAIHVASENDLDAAARSVIAALEGGAKGNVVTSPDAERELATQWQQRLSEIAQEAAKLEPSPGDWEAQIQALEQQLARAREQQLGNLELATIEVRLADALRAVGRHQDALPHLSAALTLLEALPADSGSAVEWQRARIQINLGRALETLERYPEAIRHYRGALPLYEKLEGPNSMMAAALHVNIAVLSGKLGDKAAADTHWNAALSGALAAIRDKVLAILPDSVGKLIDRLTQGRADETGGEPKGDADKARGGKGG